MWSRLAAVHADPEKARAHVRSVMTTVEQLQKGMIDALCERVSRG
jgi:hypothetical protein